MSGQPSPTEREIAEELRLRPERPAVTRLSRRVLIGLGAVAGTFVSATIMWGLATNQRKSPATELYNTDNKPTPEGLATLPRDYATPQPVSPQPLPAGIPVLGPPLPGDLGRPMRNLGGGEGGIDPEQQRLNQESDAARTSRLFATTNARPAPPGTPQHPAPSYEGLPAPIIMPSQSPLQDLDPLQSGQERKLAFLNGATDRRTVSRDRLVDPASRYVVQAGAVIPAALVTGIRSDLPGQVSAQVTEHVYDSATGTHLLIPQGSRLIGTYDSQVSFGQDRVLLVWTRLILPDGRSIVLERQPGADTQGFAGLEDEVDHHWGRLFTAAALSTLLGIGAELGAGQGDSAIITALRRGSAGSVNQAGQQLVRRELNVQPTLTIRPGFPVRAIVNRDLMLAPYRG